MPNRSRKQRLPDPNTTAFAIIQAIAGEHEASLIPTDPPIDEGKDPAAVALGRKGGLKGGKARAKSMTKKQRSESARKAALARWSAK